MIVRIGKFLVDAIKDVHAVEIDYNYYNGHRHIKQRTWGVGQEEETKYSGGRKKKNSLCRSSTKSFETDERKHEKDVQALRSISEKSNGRFVHQG